MRENEIIIFKKGNKIHYWQDFNGYIGVPSKIEFEIEQIANGRVFLIADGYGRKGKYGNGKITISLEDYERIKN